jgi:hypothetical protein
MSKPTNGGVFAEKGNSKAKMALPKSMYGFERWSRTRARAKKLA